MDDAIQHLSFDETDPATLRIGTSGGTIACVFSVTPRPSRPSLGSLKLTPRPHPYRTGQLVRDEEERSMYPNDEQNWRTSWMCSSKITSLHTSKHRIVYVAAASHVRSDVTFAQGARAEHRILFAIVQGDLPRTAGASHHRHDRRQHLARVSWAYPSL